MKIFSVVGNAESIFDKKNGTIIDRGDEIIRFNGGIIIKPESQGSKTTILAFSGYNKKKTSFGEVQYWHTVQYQERQYLKNIIGSPPSNGLVILEKLKNNYKDYHVCIFGFDWKATETWYKPNVEKKIEKHNYEKEKEYCLDLINQLGWDFY